MTTHDRHRTEKRTHGEDGVYYTYTEDSPISFNPFYTDDGVFDVEKKDSIKTLLLTLWKSEDDRVSKTESGELGSALSMFLEKMAKDKDIVPCFDSFYEFMRDEYRAEMAQRPIPIYKGSSRIFGAFVKTGRLKC